MVCWDKWIIDQLSDVPSIIFFMISDRLMALKTVYLYFCKFIKKNRRTNWTIFAMNFARSYEKKILGISNGWSMSHLSQGTSEPAYYIVDCWISRKYRTRALKRRRQWGRRGVIFFYYCAQFSAKLLRDDIALQFFAKNLTQTGPFYKRHQSNEGTEGSMVK